MSLVRAAVLAGVVLAFVTAIAPSIRLLLSSRLKQSCSPFISRTAAHT